MEALIKMISEKAGIPAAKANIAVQTLVTFLKDKMPGGVGAKVESFIKGDTATGLAGGLKEKVKEVFAK